MTSKNTNNRPKGTGLKIGSISVPVRPPVTFTGSTSRVGSSATPDREWGPWLDRTYMINYVGGKAPHNLYKAVVNDLYSVQFFKHQHTNWGEILQLMVKRNDERPIRSWKDMQRIKNDLVGAERVAVEVFPPQSELVDVGNLYWMWVLPEGFQLPFPVKD
jgi:hypothetical protein